MSFVQTSLFEYFTTNSSSDSLTTPMDPNSPTRDTMSLLDRYDAEHGTNEPEDESRRDKMSNLQRTTPEQSSDDEFPLMDLMTTRKRVRIPRIGGSSINSPRADKNDEPAPTERRPSPESAKDMTAAQHKIAYVQKLRDEHAKLNCKLSFEALFDKNGNKIWHEVLSSTAGTVRKRSQRSEVPLKWLCFEEEWSRMSLRKRRKEWNNVFENFWAAKLDERSGKRKKKKKSKKEGKKR